MPKKKKKTKKKKILDREVLILLLNSYQQFLITLQTALNCALGDVDEMKSKFILRQKEIEVDDSSGKVL